MVICPQKTPDSELLTPDSSLCANKVILYDVAFFIPQGSPLLLLTLNLQPTPTFNA
jgi:hypothetical protein